MFTWPQNANANQRDLEDLIGILNRMRLSVTEPLRTNELRNPGYVTQSLQIKVDALRM